MGGFQIIDATELQRRMVARIVARSELTDLAPADPMMQLTGAAADELEDIYIAVARLLELFSIDGSHGADLDRRALDVLPDGLLRGGASRATGTLRWETAVGVPVAVDVPIPAGTVAAKAGNPRTLYVTTVAGVISAGSTQSNPVGGPAGADIPASAVEAGLAGNAVADSFYVLVTSIPNAVTATNPNPFANGRDAETDDDFRSRIREFTRTLARCTLDALEGQARTAEIDGRRVIASRAWEDPINRGYVKLYIDDGSGQITETAIASAEWLTDSVAGAAGGEQEFYVRNWPVTDAPITVTHVPAGGAAVVLVLDVDYIFLPSRGYIWLHPDVFPTGLGVGDGLKVAEYIHYAGLIRLAQLLIEGRASDRENYPAWRAAGVVVRVLPPLSIHVEVSGQVTALTDADRPAVVAAVTREISAYVNGIGIGSAVIMAEIVERAMGVAGMYDFVLSAPSTNIPVAFNEVARLTIANITIM